MSNDSDNDPKNIPDDLEFDRPEEPQPSSSSEPKRFKIPLGVKLVLIGFIAFLGAMGYLRTVYQPHDESVAHFHEQPDELPPVEKRKQAPDITLVAGAGKTRQLSDFRGKVVLLSFWASWCTPCLVELPTFIDLYESLGDQGLVILPLNVDEPDVAANFVTNFWKKRSFPFPTYYDPDKKASDAFELNNLPSNYVIDKSGKTVAMGFGANDWSNDESKAIIKALLAEKIN